MKTISQADIPAMVRGYHARLFAQSGPPAVQETGDPNDDPSYNAEETRRRMRGLLAVLQDSDYSTPDEGTPRGEAVAAVHAEARALVGSQGCKIDELPAGTRGAILEGVARALLDDHRMYLHQLKDRLTPYGSADPLFASPSIEAAAATKAASLSLSEALDRFIEAHAGIAWKPKTEVDFRRACRWAEEALGSDTPIASITKDHVRRAPPRQTQGSIQEPPDGRQEAAASPQDRREALSGLNVGFELVGS